LHAKSTVQLKGAGSSQSGAIYEDWVANYRYYRDVVECVPLTSSLFTLSLSLSHLFFFSPHVLFITNPTTG
jgi:hypothetical protein